MPPPPHSLGAGSACAIGESASTIRHRDSILGARLLPCRHAGSHEEHLARKVRDHLAAGPANEHGFADYDPVAAEVVESGDEVEDHAGSEGPFVSIPDRHDMPLAPIRRIVDPDRVTRAVPQ